MTEQLTHHEHKCPCKEFKMKWTMKDERAFQSGEKSGKKDGYTKALDDVEKIIDGWLKIETCTSEGEHADMLLKELKQSLAEFKEKKT